MKSASKNQRTITTSGPYTEVGTVARFAALGAGWCYIFDPRAPKTHHVKVNSDKFWEIMDAIEEKAGRENLLAESQKLADKFPDTLWPEVVSRLRSNPE